MPATIKDIAKKVGVNPSTVSRVINGTASISEETKQKIKDAMRELDYHPNSLARSLVNGSTFTIGLVIPLMDARRNNVYAGFYKNGRIVQPEAHLSFEEVLEKVKPDSQVTFVGEVENFAEQIQAVLPEAFIKTTLPNAALLAKIGLQLPARSVHDFVPNYLKRVEAEENWLKNHEETKDSYIKRL